MVLKKKAIFCVHRKKKEVFSPFSSIITNFLRQGENFFSVTFSGNDCWQIGLHFFPLPPTDMHIITTRKLTFLPSFLPSFLPKKSLSATFVLVPHSCEKKMLQEEKGIFCPPPLHFFLAKFGKMTVGKSKKGRWRNKSPRKD